MNWKNTNDLYEFSLIKYTHKIIMNENNPHNFRYYLLEGRNDLKRKSYKIGPHKPIIGRSQYTQSSYFYSTVNIYNKLPDNLTQIKKPSLFKSWLKKYFNDKNIQIPNNMMNPENIVEDPESYFSYDTTSNCFP